MLKTFTDFRNDLITIAKLSPAQKGTSIADGTRLEAVEEYWLEAKKPIDLHEINDIIQKMKPQTYGLLKSTVEGIEDDDCLYYKIRTGEYRNHTLEIRKAEGSDTVIVLSITKRK